jgi:hypothetical protein
MRASGMMAQPTEAERRVITVSGTEFVLDRRYDSVK